MCSLMRLDVSHGSAHACGGGSENLGGHLAAASSAVACIFSSHCGIVGTLSRRTGREQLRQAPLCIIKQPQGVKKVSEESLRRDMHSMPLAPDDAAATVPPYRPTLQPALTLQTLLPGISTLYTHTARCDG